VINFIDSLGADLGLFFGSIRTIAQKADSIMTNYEFIPRSQYTIYDSIAKMINAAFVGPFDTVSWLSTRSLVLKGARPVSEISFLLPSPTLAGQTNGTHYYPEIPEAYTLFQNYPNPFNPSTLIRYMLTEPGDVTLKVYNVLGQEVATLINHEEYDAGEYEIFFDASDLPSGVYYYRLRTGSFSDVKKMVLVK